MIIKVGTTQFDTDQFKDWTKEQFVETFTGKLSEDIHATWDQIDKLRPKDKPKPKRKAKKSVDKTE